MKTMGIEVLVRPIIGIENRSAREVFDIMSDRILSALTPDPDRLLALTAAAKTIDDILAMFGQRVTGRDTATGEPLFWGDDYGDCMSPKDAILAALSRIEAQAEARGWNNAMLTAMERVADTRNAHSPGPIFKALNEALGKIDDARFAGLRRYQTDATEAADKGGV